MNKLLFLRCLAGLVAVASVSTAAAAGVYKCAQPDGRVVFSDNPCTPEQSGGAMKGVVSASPSAPGPASGGPTTSIENTRQKATRERVHQALTPECRALGERASRALQSGSDASMDEVKRAVSEFEGRCADQIVEAARKESSRGNKNAPLDAASCQKLRQSLDADRARLGRMTDKEKMAFAAQQNEVSVACR